MTKTKKALALAMCAVLLVVSTVFVTMAYLTSTDKVTNTFTVGNVAITLDETDVDEDGVAIEGANRVKANEYKLMPGHTYVKDPQVHVAANSEECYLFVKLENGLKDIIDATTIENQMRANGWSLLSLEGNTNVYAYETTIAKSNEVTNIDVFDTFKIIDNVSNQEAEGTNTLAYYKDAKIIVTAYAIQADGFSDELEAWNAAPVSWVN